MVDAPSPDEEKKTEGDAEVVSPDSLANASAPENTEESEILASARASAQSINTAFITLKSIMSEQGSDMSKSTSQNLGRLNELTSGKGVLRFDANVEGGTRVLLPVEGSTEKVSVSFNQKGKRKWGHAFSAEFLLRKGIELIFIPKYRLHLITRNKEVLAIEVLQSGVVYGFLVGDITSDLDKEVQVKKISKGESNREELSIQSPETEAAIKTILRDLEAFSLFFYQSAKAFQEALESGLERNKKLEELQRPLFDAGKDLMTFLIENAFREEDEIKEWEGGTPLSPEECMKLPFSEETKNMLINLGGLYKFSVLHEGDDQETLYIFPSKPAEGSWGKCFIIVKNPKEDFLRITSCPWIDDPVVNIEQVGGRIIQINPVEFYEPELHACGLGDESINDSELLFLGKRIVRHVRDFRDNFPN